MTWIIGEAILKRPRWTEFRLKQAYKRGLSPYRDFDDAKMTQTSHCFNCVHASPGYTPGHLDKEGRCIPIKLPDAPELSPFPPHDLQGLDYPYTPLELAMKINPALVKYYFDDGEFVFHSGVFTDGIHPQVASLMIGVLGSSVLERLMIEGLCSDFAPMGYIDMGDRLKSAKFKLKEVERYERSHRMGQFETDQEENVSPHEEWPTEPLDLGKALLAKDEYRSNPAKRIRLMKERHPYLKSAEIAAYARGYPPDPNNEGACKRWYQRNKPK